MAEKNRRLYGWPIPAHLRHIVATLAPASEDNATSTASRKTESNTSENVNDGANTKYGQRMAAGMGKLQEIDLGPEAIVQNIQRTEEARRRLERGEVSVSDVEPAKVRLGKDGKPRRNRNRRNSEDLRRDMMVEAVLREAKRMPCAPLYCSCPKLICAVDYFEEDKPPSPPSNGNENTEDAMVEQFRLEFLESMEPHSQKKPAAPSGPKGAKEPARGPKLGGSRSARAAMRLQEEQAAKNKR